MFSLHKKTKNIWLWVGSYIFSKLASNGHSNIHPEIYHFIEKMGVGERSEQGGLPPIVHLIIIPQISDLDVFLKKKRTSVIKYFFLNGSGGQRA